MSDNENADRWVCPYCGAAADDPVTMKVTGGLKITCSECGKTEFQPAAGWPGPPRTDGGYEPPMVTCPAGICSKQVAVFDHDRMFGHLLVDHSWTFATAQAWVTELMPEDEGDEAERRLLAGEAD